MDKTLRKKIEVVITNSYTATSMENYICTDTMRGQRPYVDGLIEENPKVWQLNNRQAKLLLKLSQQLSTKELAALHRILKDYCKDNYREEIVDTAMLYFVHSGRTMEILPHINKTFTSYDQRGSLHCVKALSESLLHRPDLFSDSEAEAIYDWCRAYLTGKTSLGKSASEYRSSYSETTKEIRHLNSRANELLARNFEKQVDAAFNPELNADEDKVLEAIEQVGFSVDVSDSLLHIRDLVDRATTPPEYRDAMSSMRVFTEQLYGRIAQRLDSETKVNGMDSKKAAQLFREKKLISHDVSELIVAHRHFLSNDGTHRLKSRKEDARIAKNMTIEISLYLLTRLREMD